MYDAGILALGAIGVLEDAVSACKAALEYHSTIMVQSHPGILAGVSRGGSSFRHGAIMIDEFATLRENGGLSAEAMSRFEATLLRLAPKTTAEGIYTHCARLARAIKSEADAAQREADCCGAGEDHREHRTLAQLRADIAAILLLGPKYPRWLK